MKIELRIFYNDNINLWQIAARRTYLFGLIKMRWDYLKQIKAYNVNYNDYSDWFTRRGAVGYSLEKECLKTYKILLHTFTKVDYNFINPLVKPQITDKDLQDKLNDLLEGNESDLEIRILKKSLV